MKPGKKGYPRFRHHCRSVEYKQTGWKLEPDGRHLTFTDGCGIGRVRLRGTREVASFPTIQIKRVRLLRRADGYYVQFAVAVERRVAHVATGRVVGIDVGLMSFYTDSNGRSIANPRYLRNSERRLRVLSQRFSRKNTSSLGAKKPKVNHAARHRAKHNKYPPQQMSYAATAETTPASILFSPDTPPPGNGMKRRSHSAKWQRARIALARKHLKVQRQREDFARKQASALVSSHDLIALEDLQVRNLVKNRRLAKSISDVGWARFRHWVEYYGKLHGIPVIAVPSRYTSQYCSQCNRLVAKSLSMRTHVCPTCGLILDRDHNAARNILARASASHSASAQQLRTVGHTET